MHEIYVLPIYKYRGLSNGIPAHTCTMYQDKQLYNPIAIDTTSGNGQFRDLSPFVLGPCATYLPGAGAADSDTVNSFWINSR